MNNGLNRSTLILGLMLGLFFLYFMSVRDVSDANAEEFALGKGTGVRLARVNNIQVHCQDLNDMRYCLDGYKSTSNKKPVVLWLGNSQIHAINQMKSTDETAIPELYKKLHKKGVSLITFSQPNASLQEHFLLFQYLQNRLPIRTLIIPLVFDDMRETGIRSSLVDTLKDHSVALALTKTKIGQELLTQDKNQDSAGNDLSALKDTTQEKTEKYLNSKMGEFSSIWLDRPQIRGQIMLSLYLFRNWALGINPSSIRKMIPSRYISNKLALEAMLDEAKRKNIHIIIYIVPLRNDVPVPYNKEEYSIFKLDMKKIALTKKVYFVNLENLIPSKYWGSKDSTSVNGEMELDFMHFQASGHKIFSDRLYNELQKMELKLNNDF